MLAGPVSSAGELSDEINLNLLMARVRSRDFKHTTYHCFQEETEDFSFP